MAGLAELRQTTGAVLCIECGKCTASCPLAAYGRVSPRAIVASADRDTDPGDPDGVTQCLTCAACEVRCPQGVHFIDFVKGVRERLPGGERAACPHWGVLTSAARMMASREQSGRRPQWITDDLEVSTEGEVALFVGCLPLFDALFGEQFDIRMQDIARAAVRLLNHLGIAPVIIAEERCCGHDLLWRGDVATFSKLARANAAAFAERGVRHVLTTCAECCRTWRLDYPQAAGDYRPRVEHLTEFLAARLERGDLTLSNRSPQTLTYHDPCRLGRHLGIYDAPRRILEAVPGTRLVEMSHSRHDAQCCGTSGFMHCDACSRQLQARRLRSAAHTGAAKLITACPKCLIHFSCTQHEDRRRGADPAIEIQDVTVYAASMLPDTEPAEPSALRNGKPSRTGTKGGPAQ